MERRGRRGLLYRRIWIVILALLLLATLGLSPPEFCAQASPSPRAKPATDTDTSQAEYLTPKQLLEQGNDLGQRGKWDEAIQRYRRALTMQPGYAEAHYNLGNAFAAQHKIDQALEEYQEALRLKPGLPGVHRNLCALFESLGKMVQAAY
jgi:tetratricopeptide (TPR) repeat protein